VPLLALRPVAAAQGRLAVALEHPVAVGLELPLAVGLELPVALQEVAVRVLELGRPRRAARFVAAAAVVGRASAAVEQIQSTQ